MLNACRVGITRHHWSLLEVGSAAGRNLNTRMSLIIHDYRLRDHLPVSDSNPDHRMVSYIQWHSYDTWNGRLFAADDHGHMKWTIPGFNRPRERRVVRVIIPDIGLDPMKPKDARPKISEDVERLRAMWNIFVQTTASVTVPSSNCCICGTTGSARRVCAICECVVHDACILDSMVRTKHEVAVAQVCVFQPL